MSVLLGVALVLLGLRVIVVPWVRAQDEAHDRLAVLTQRLDRSVGVIENRAAIEATRSRLAALAPAEQARFPTPADPQSYRLQVQQQVNQIAASVGLKVSLFDWMVDGELPESGLSYGRVRIRFDGPLRDLVRVHGEFEGQLQNAVVREYGFNAQTPVAAIDQSPGGAVFVVDLLYRRGKPQ